jgi:hypothetical protein
VNDNQPLTGLTTSSSPTSPTDTSPATVKQLFLCQDVCPSDLPPPTILPRDECCWGLPGDAHSILCNAGPLSLSAYSQSPNTQTTDTTLPSSTQLQPLPHVTNRPISQSVPRPKSLQASSALCYATNESHSTTQKTTSCRASVSADLPPPMSLLRDECCRGLPGDAQNTVSPAMQAPCLSRQLLTGRFISQVLRYMGTPQKIGFYKILFLCYV